MFSARRLVGLGILTVALIGCKGVPSVTGQRRTEGFANPDPGWEVGPSRTS